MTEKEMIFKEEYVMMNDARKKKKKKNVLLSVGLNCLLLLR